MSGDREYQPGDEFGAYALEQRLGGGGFGSVWRARHRENGQLVALKILNASAYATDTVALRSEVELLAATASSRSSHVVRVLGGGAEPKPHVVMEFIDGVDLARELDRRGRIPQLETIRIGRAVADALAALQDVGIIHRDVKPANVMIDVDGVVKLTDFGIAKIVGFDTITATSQMPMSMAYAAPEVWEGSASHRSDIYSLGILIFQCLAGRPPFTGSYAQVFRQHATKDPDWTFLPDGTVPALRDLLRTCLAKTEDERPAGGVEVEVQLAEAERQLLTRTTSSEKMVPAHEPHAFGPWLFRWAHPTQQWAFICIHETTGEKATVEIHFSDGIQYGTQLRKAVAANPQLVPLGAERLLGTNRLVLRPGEAWTNAPAGQFQFWVAREELPQPKVAQTVDADLLRTAAANALRIESAAVAAAISLAWTADCAFLLESGEVFLARPGLPRSDGSHATADLKDWLALLPLDLEARRLLETRTLEQLAGPQEANSTVIPAAGVAQLADAAYQGGATEGAREMVTWRGARGGASRTAVPDVLPPEEPEAAVEIAPAQTDGAAGGSPPRRNPRWRVPVAWAGSIVLVSVLILAVLTPFCTAPPRANPCGDGSVSGRAEDCPTATPVVPATATSFSTFTPSSTMAATPTAIPTPAATVADTPSPTPNAGPSTASPTAELDSSNSVGAIRILSQSRDEVIVSVAYSYSGVPWTGAPAGGAVIQACLIDWVTGFAPACSPVVRASNGASFIILTIPQPPNPLSSVGLNRIGAWLKTIDYAPGAIITGNSIDYVVPNR